MDKKSANSKRRQLYAERTPDQRRDALLRRRLIYAQKKGTDLQGHPPVSNPELVGLLLVAPLAPRVPCVVGADHPNTQPHVLVQTLPVCCAAFSISPQASPLPHRPRRASFRAFNNLPTSPWILPAVQRCIYCGAFRFYREPPGFWCGDGQVFLAPRELVPDLIQLLLGGSSESAEFRKHIRSYNNRVAFTSIGMKADHQYCWSNKGIYSLVVQGMVFHYINGVKEAGSTASNLDLYFHETDSSVVSGGRRGAQIDPALLSRLLQLLKQNPYTRFFKSLRAYDDLERRVIILRTTPQLDQRTFNLPTVGQVGAIWSESESSTEVPARDIRVYVNEDVSHQIQYYYGCYDPLQYPLMFPRGEPGWHAQIFKSPKYSHHGPSDGHPYSLDEASNLISPSLAESAAALLENEAAVLRDSTHRDSTISLRQYYCYLFQMRSNDKSYILHFGRLTQQFCIDMYIKLETQRLDYYRSEQRQMDLRTDTYQGLLDSMSIDGQNDPSAIGRRFVLPSSFIGGPRDMRRRYVNAMSLVQKYGKPDIFLTMTCNPSWPEITVLLLDNERAEDRPDLVARVFKAKLDELKNDIVRRKLFGPVAAYVYVVEFQKRGLPHVHWLIILKSSHKISSPEQYDNIISAELPLACEHPLLRSYVIKHMMHGPCGVLNPSNSCMSAGDCKNHYPKRFSDITHVAANGYPMYRRRRSGDVVNVRGADLDNRWVVPYNPFLLAKFNCHINVEVCADIKLVKYLYKYIYKGHDRVAYNIVGEVASPDYDEIRQFQTGRWVAAPEAHWRIYGFALSDMHPPVIVLQVHLENQHTVRFGRQQSLQDIVLNPFMRRTMLTEFFRLNAVDEHAKSLNLLYREFPEFFVWSGNSKSWSPRSRKEVVGRLVTVNPCEGERFFERLLLNNIRSPPSAEFLRTVNGHQYPTFREAAQQLGLLESDTYIFECLEEASLHQLSYSFRRLFATILVYCTPSDPVRLWDAFKSHLSHDFLNQSTLSENAAEQKALESVHFILQSMGKSINDYSLTPDAIRLSEESRFANELAREKAILVSPADLLAQDLLNSCQRNAFDAVVTAFESDKGGFFFVDGPGGSGKTFLYRAILAFIRTRGYIALSVATSGVAASLLPGGRTAHSRFKFPIDIEEGSDSTLSKQSGLSRLIKSSKVIVWDEVTMANRRIVESLDKLLRELCDPDVPFGGKVVLFGGDFRQTLPIIVGGSRDEMIGASLVSSTLWPSICKLKLRTNMRARADPAFNEFLLRIGDGTHPFIADDIIQLPSYMCIPYTDPAKSLSCLINCVFPTFTADPTDPYSVVSRAILTPKNDVVDDINDQLIQKFPGTPFEYISFDKTDDPNQQNDYADFLGSVCVSGLPPHKLVLKLNCPVMLLRNVDPAEGLCNGTRLIVKHLGPRLISAEIAIGDYKGRHVFIPRIPLQATDRYKCPVAFKRHQFPLRLCFAMTINKAQGQTLDYVGVYLHEPVFSHGQLYVALSRARSSNDVKVLVRPVLISDADSPPYSTRNVVYPEIFALAA